MLETIIESVGMAKAGNQQSVEFTDKALKLLEEREMARHEPNAYPRNRLPSPIAHENIKHVSDTFGVVRHSRYGWYAHCGVDIAAAEGTELLTVAKCVVTSIVHSNRGWGNRIYFKILEGPYKHYKVAYCHCLKIDQGIKKGDVLEKGILVAWVGTTGNSTGPHLHLMIGNNLNPNRYAIHSTMTTTIGFHNAVDYFSFKGCHWG